MHFDLKNSSLAESTTELAGADEETFSAELRRLRVAAGLTMEQLAEASGVSARSISNMERGHTRTPHRRTVAILAQALHLNTYDRERLAALSRAEPRPSGGQGGLGANGTELVGRESELADLRAALHSAQRLRGTALVLRGGPGIGKTALLRDALAYGSAHALTVLSVTGVSAETHLPFTGLRQLLDPVLGSGDPGTEAARHLVLQAVGERPSTGSLEPYQIALAALELVTGGPRQPARLLVVDDAQWLDRQSWDAVAFLARRIATHPVTMFIGMRDSSETSTRLASAGLPELRVEPLEPASCRILVDRTAPDLAPHVRTWVLDEAAGHPLALIDLAVAVAVTGIGWDPATSTTLPLSDRLQNSYNAALHALPTTVQTALQIAALHDSDDTDEILAASRVILAAGLTVTDLRPALDSHLLTETPGHLRFRHPLIRAAVRQSMPASLRLRAHTAIAQVVGPHSDRGVRHRVAATEGTDNDLAEDLSNLAHNLRRKGAVATASEAWERAADLTTDRQRRATHHYWAWETARCLGDADRMQYLTKTIDAAHLPLVLRVSYVKGSENSLTTGWSPATMVADMAASVRLLHKQGQTDTAASALATIGLRCFWAPPDAPTRGGLIAAAEGLGLPPLDHRLFVIHALIAPLERGRIALDTITALLREPPDSARQDYSSVGVAATAVGAHPEAKVFLAADAALHRAQGTLGDLGEVLGSQGFASAQLGEVTAALAYSQEAQLIADTLGKPFWALSARLNEAQAEAMRGNTAVAMSMAEQAERSLLAYGPNPLLALVQLARGITHLAQGKSTDAYDALTRILDPNDPAYQPYIGLAAMPHIAEAGATSPQRLDDLRDLIRTTEPTAELCGWPPLLIGMAQAKAHLAPDDNTFTTALDTIPTPWAFERARTQLAYGSWLRRQHQTGRARPHLQAAWHTFQALSTTPWAHRARTELRAAGAETVAAQPDHDPEQLTAQELQIARLAATDLTNRQIGEHLHLSPRTVSTHLYRVYPKLGITSRRHLAHALPPEESPGRTSPDVYSRDESP